MSLEKIKKMQT